MTVCGESMPSGGPSRMIAVPTATNSIARPRHEWRCSSIRAPTIPDAESALASSCIRVIASSRAS